MTRLGGGPLGYLPLLVGALAAAACGTGPSELAAPAPELGMYPRAGDSALARPVSPPQDDPAADEEALYALQELEFRSLAKGSDHVRGVLPAPDLESMTGGPMLLAGSRGGAASVAPTYDIDVETFADQERVKYYVDYFLGPARERFTIWLGRLNRYEGMIRSRFRGLGVPEDLVYLGIIESGYSNTAVSRANAVGMWQFIRSTARLYGLTIDAWVDERRDPFKATDAAGRYLADLNEVFGSWYLAAAAYNGGEGRVLRGIRRLSSLADTLTDATFFDLSNRRYLRRETRDYVPKLIAATIIAKDPERYGLEGLPRYEPLVFDEITVPAATGLDVVARLADTTSRALMELNPQYVRGVTPPNQSAIVRVPRGKGPLVLERYAALPPSERVNFVEHVVRRGQTLSEIGRRYGVSVSVLRAANGYVNPRRLRIGQRLIIPLSPAARSRVAAGDVPRASSGTPGLRYHVVRRGDTLWKLSQRYGVTVGELRRWNDVWGNEVLRIGERLKVGQP